MSNNTSQKGFFLLEAVVSVMVCVALSCILLQYKAFKLRVHTAQKELIKNLYTAERALIYQTSSDALHNKKTLAQSRGATLYVHSISSPTTQRYATCFRFSQ